MDIKITYRYPKLYIRTPQSADPREQSVKPLCCAVRYALCALRLARIDNPVDRGLQIVGNEIHRYLSGVQRLFSL